MLEYFWFVFDLELIMELYIFLCIFISFSFVFGYFFGIIIQYFSFIFLMKKENNAFSTYES